MSSDILGAVADELEGDEVERPVVFEFGIVHEVDPRTLAVKAIIPSIDPDRVHDRWIHQAVPWVGSPGYGPAFAPAVGSEVLITGRFGQSYSLLYLCAYNTQSTVPGEFADGSRGLKTDTPLRLLAEQLIEIVGQQAVRIEAAEAADVKGQSVRLFAGGAEMFRVEGSNAGFRGAAIARRTLPAPGPTDTPLVVAIRQLLIDLRLAQ
jgi:hypothetical protein